MRRYQTKKYTKAQGERILWHAMDYLQYSYPEDSERDGFGLTGRWKAIQTIKQLLGVSVAPMLTQFELKQRIALEHRIARLIITDALKAGYRSANKLADKYM